MTEPFAVTVYVTPNPGTGHAQLSVSFTPGTDRERVRRALLIAAEALEAREPGVTPSGYLVSEVNP